MTVNGYEFGHSSIIGDPGADWSHASSYLASLYKDRLEAESPLGDNFEEDSRFRQSLTSVRGVDELSEEDQRLAQDLAESDGVDISYFPGGDNYRASLVSASNPLGLPGNLWALVADPSEGAFVASLMRVTDEGELEIKFPDGYDWQPLTDPSVVSDYDIVGVTDDAVALFNNYDRDNTLGVIGSYPLSDKGPFPTQEQLSVPMSAEIPEPRTEDDEYWRNSGQSYSLVSPVTAAITVDSADDLDAAIAAAAQDPEIRWYVERRIRALGLEADLPWQEG